MPPGPVPAPQKPPPETTGRHLPVGFVQPAAPLPGLRADEGDLARAVDRAWGLLLAANRNPWLFRAAGLPSWIVPDDEGRPFAAAVTDERLRHMLARLAVWRRLNRNGDLVPAPPPTAMIKSLLATPDPGLPVLAGIVTTPVFGRGGTLLSTPTIKGVSRIDAAWEESDQRRFWVPCPDCGEHQILRWEQVRWDKDDAGNHRPETAHYVCEHCGVIWNDARRWAAVRLGEWRAGNPFAGIAGFHLNEIYSSWVRLEAMARSYDDCPAERGLSANVNVVKSSKTHLFFKVLWVEM